MKFIHGILIRLYEVIIKAISIKGSVFILSTILLFNKLIDPWMWYSLGILFISVRFFEKLFIPSQGK